MIKKLTKKTFAIYMNLNSFLLGHYLQAHVIRIAAIIGAFSPLPILLVAIFCDYS